ncbi:MAG: C cytochrome precursor, partial [Pirellulaceae bacterium]
SPPKLSDDDRQVAASVQWLLKGDAGQRALMAWSYGWSDAQQAAGTQWMAPYLGQLLEDPYDAVRYIAQRSLNRIPGFEEVEGGFLGNSAQQKESHASVLTIWSQQTGPPQIKNVLRLLIDSEGNIMTKRFDELLRQRDDREVRLLE